MKLKGLPHIKRPDGDNLEKFINDALAGVLWCDDARIFAMMRVKAYTNEKVGYTELFVTEYKNEPIDYYKIINDITDNLVPAEINAA